MEESRDIDYTRLREEVNLELVNAIALLKLVKDKEFCNEAENQLARLKDVMMEDKRFRISTLQEFKKIIRKGVQKTVSKLVLENPTQRINSGIYGSNTLYNVPNVEATSYFNSPTHCYSPNDRFVTNPEQRLALKYPRKKICKPYYDGTTNTSGEMSVSQNSLFKRRHELIVPQPQPTTYGEYRRMAQYQNYLRTQNMIQTVTVNRVSINDYKPPQCSQPNDYNASASKQFINSAQHSAQIDSCESNSATNSAKLYKSNDNNSEEAQNESSINVEPVLSETSAKTNQQQSDDDGLVTATKAMKQHSAKVNSVTSTVTTTQQQSVNEDSLTAAKTSHHPSDHVDEDPVHDSGTSNTTTTLLTANAEKQKPLKPKSKGNHRELHDLLSYTTEIFPKLIANRTKSVCAEEEINMQLLRKFGITKRVQIVLERVNMCPIVLEHEEPGQIAQRTRSKSIDTRKCLGDLDAKSRKLEPVPNKISHRRESKALDVKAITSTTSVQNKISHRRESKSLDVKKLTAATSTSLKASKQTARKSSSKPHKTVHAVATSIKKAKEVKPVIENDSTEMSRKRRKPSSSPPPSSAKRSRSVTKDSKNLHKEAEKLRNVAEQSDEDDESTTLSPSEDLNHDVKPNNDPDVHCRSDYMEKCCLCSYNGELMVHHYVYNHPKKAVYISRVAPEQARLIRADPLGISGRKAISRYGDQEIIVFRCHFCDLRLSESQELWLDHISKHTGEYRYKCMLCPTFARLPVDRVPHHSICTNPSMQLWHTYGFQENHLYAYMCNVCNFVQVLSVNMMRHIREDHPEAGSSKIGYTKFSLVNFSLQDDEADLPYGAMKLEPILDDTNIILPENIKEEVELMSAEDSQTDPLQAVEQEQPPFVQPETVLIKQENFTDSHDECETNAFESIDENGTDVMTTVSASAPQETEGSLSSRVRVKRLPGDVLSAETEGKGLAKVLKTTVPVNHSLPLNIHNNQMKHLTGAALNTGIQSNKLENVPKSTNQVNHSPKPQAINHQLQRSIALSPKSVCSGNGQRQLSLAASMVLLKPWSVTNGGYSGKILSKKLTVPFLIAPYKCTAFDCGFYTDKMQIICTHLQSHQKTASMHPTLSESPWLECCYCDHVGTNVFTLLQHVQTVHKDCGYQCDRCCYRSRDASNVRVHQRNYHSEHDAEVKILCIPNRQKAFELKDNDIIVNELRSNVKALKCSICTSKKFYDLNEYRKHIISHNMSYMACHVCDDLLPPRELIDHIHAHNIYMFQCVYCAFGSSDMRNIKKHVADKHPERLLCFHVRTSKPNVPSFIRVQEKISPDRFVHFKTG
ncbi:uncharacterized protein LOC118507157 isoform X1 [Anopheles stephensi]|uniref:uncharacterized protein LOC118507157 isoform X1 n=1 Tax=Anopheles stephensi TaxID=30069 RepID=UPI001658BF9B|nr:uncharacterized protein LOC118507157 isoform X1 [Anopheles stephensi]XP_035901096.1 uncharacterized protein LOC118507157 isoform X1 [Anopheles stephensi]XP_035901097.1 uncharacterized protein LOC118507157 isoform X1 [Anopheles stephensi]XP_035901098.1 uncharacterized protein LOC118507157 isoform X1 [Anopheles stephensi]